MNILQNKKEFDIIDNITIIDTLPIANYELKYGAFGRIYLQQIEDIVLPKKVYSNDVNFISHVLNQWFKSSNSLGIGLVGKKGLGKSFTGNIIANELKIPVIRITTNPKGLDIFNFLNTIKQDYCLYIDEFEKIFPHNPQNNNNGDSSLTSQEKFLSFLDNGGTISKFRKMFIITSNSLTSINEFLKNRPSRLRYIQMYEKLEDAVIKEIVEDLLENKNFLNDLTEHLPYETLNMDSLIQIVKEVNLHNKPYSKFKTFFNFQEEKSFVTYTIYEKSTNEILSSQMPLNKMYEGNKVGIFQNKTVYFESSIPANLEILEKKAYYYNDNEEPQYIDIIIVKNQVVNKFNFLAY